MNTIIADYIKKNENELFRLLKELCLIPAPSHKEEKRAEYCKNYLEACGAKGVYIDEALNVVYPLGSENSDKITVFVAHTDTVFPDTEPMPYIEDDGKIYCPGVGDDTASLAVLLMTAKFFIENNIVPQNGVLFVCNSCEEGLGNLKGTRQIFKDYAGRISQFISYDSNLDVIADDCAGSHRYKVEVKTQGGHSYLAFGNKNAINELSKIVNAIYNISLPQKEGRKATYNVGEIAGGTSVNTIAQSASMLCEYRSDDKDLLAFMQAKFEEIFKVAETEGVTVQVNKIGDRPCSDIVSDKIDKLKEMIVPIIENEIGKEVKFATSSTDCNVPLSMGIPALCMGVFYGGGMHTREEWIEKQSLPIGLSVSIKTALKLLEVSL